MRHLIQRGCFGDVWTWICDEDVHNRLFRIWYVNRNRPQKPDGTFVYSDDYYENDECKYR